MSDVLLIAPTMNPSIVIPRPGTDLSVTNPRAYDRVKQYLKDRLRTRIFPHYDRVLSTHGIDEVKRIYGPIHALGKDGAIKALRTQLKDYWRREYPFHEDVAGGDSLAWWQKLIEHPRANVLAVRDRPMDCCPPGFTDNTLGPDACNRALFYPSKLDA